MSETLSHLHLVCLVGNLPCCARGDVWHFEHPTAHPLHNSPPEDVFDEGPKDEPHEDCPTIHVSSHAFVTSFPVSRSIAVPCSPAVGWSCDHRRFLNGKSTCVTGAPRAIFPGQNPHNGGLERAVNVVGVRGFEPPAPCSQSRCATRLRHTPMPRNPITSGPRRRQGRRPGRARRRRSGAGRRRPSGVGAAATLARRSAGGGADAAELRRTDSGPGTSSGSCAASARPRSPRRRPSRRSACHRRSPPSSPDSAECRP